MTVPPVWASGGGTSGGCGGDGNSNRNPEHAESTRPDQEIYRRQSRLLSQRCKQIAQHSRLLVNRLYQVKKLTKRYKKEIKFLMARLDMHGDDFRSIKIEDDEKQHYSNNVVIKTEKGSSGKLVINEKSLPTKRSASKKKSSRTDKGDKEKNSVKKPIISTFPLNREYQAISLGEGSSDIMDMSNVDKNRLALKWKLLLEEKKSKMLSG